MLDTLVPNANFITEMKRKKVIDSLQVGYGFI